MPDETWGWEQIAVYLLEPIDGQNVWLMEKVAERLKQSDGEGWAAGEMLERAIKVFAAKRSFKFQEDDEA